MDLEVKLSVLADAAKYDVSCSSSGKERKSAKGRLGKTGLGGTGTVSAEALERLLQLRFGSGTGQPEAAATLHASPLLETPGGEP